ncbi:MAG: hypothetical protein WDN29_01570 [Methylovirgula sp.]
MLTDAQLRSLIDDDLVRAHRARALDPEHPFIRGTAHNPDTFFQTREAVNAYYDRVPGNPPGCHEQIRRDDRPQLPIVRI